jgi:hypothetical protein
MPIAPEIVLSRVLQCLTYKYFVNSSQNFQSSHPHNLGRLKNTLSCRGYIHRMMRTFLEKQLMIVTPPYTSQSE